MEKTTLIALRDAHKTDDGEVAFITDNPRIYNEVTDVIIWDDTDGIVYVLRTNDNYKEAVTKPFLLETFTYDVIQYITSSITIKKMRSIADSLVTKGILTTTRRDTIIEYFRKYDTTHMPSPGTNP